MTGREAVVAFLKDDEAQRAVFSALDITGPSKVTVRPWSDELEKWWRNRLEAERAYLRDRGVDPDLLTDDEVEASSAVLRDLEPPPAEKAVPLHGCDRCGQPWMLLARRGEELVCAKCRKGR